MSKVMFLAQDANMVASLDTSGEQPFIRIITRRGICKVWHVKLSPGDTVTSESFIAENPYGVFPSNLIVNGKKQVARVIPWGTPDRL